MYTYCITTPRNPWKKVQLHFNRPLLYPPQTTPNKSPLRFHRQISSSSSSKIYDVPNKTTWRPLLHRISLKVPFYRPLISRISATTNQKEEDKLCRAKTQKVGTEERPAIDGHWQHVSRQTEVDNDVSPPCNAFSRPMTLFLNTPYTCPSN